MTVIPRQTKTKMNPADYMFTVSPETHAKADILFLKHACSIFKPGSRDWEDRQYSTGSPHQSSEI